MDQQDIPNFDTLLHMAKTNPNELEELRIRLTQRTINQAPERLRPRLRGLQFQIDAKRKLAKTPMAACIALSDMMHRSLYDLNEYLHNPVDPQNINRHSDKKSNTKVLTLPTSKEITANTFR